MLTHRLQILMEEDHFQRLAREAQRRNMSIGALIREAVDKTIEADMERRRAAVEAILASEPMEVPDDPADIRRELDEAHDRFPR